MIEYLIIFLGETYTPKKARLGSHWSWNFRVYARSDDTHRKSLPPNS